MATYLPINLAAFFLIDLLAKRNGGSLTIANFAGLGTKSPLLAVSLTVVMLALVGLPPTVGFTAKLLIFSALFNAYELTGNGWLLALFSIGLLNAVVSLAYYLKIPFLMFFRPAVTEVSAVRLSPVAVGIAVGLAGLIVVLFFSPDRLLNWIATF
jgi:NADH-quinone oxidoreductase subunit N